MINSVIVQHLKSNKRLIIPGFGAFIKKDETGEVVFVEFLKKDDGALVAELQQNYSLDRNQATEIIDNYVVNAKKQILKSGKYIIDHLGTMYIDANSAYNFEYNPVISQGTEVQSKPQIEVQTTPIVKPTVNQPVNPTTRRTAGAEPGSEQIAQQPRATSAAPQERVVRTEPEPTPYSTPRPAARTEYDQQSDRIDVKGLQYQKPSKPPIPGQNKKKTDTIMLIAIIAATIAILSMIYGMFNSDSPELTIEPTHIEQPAPAQE